MPVLLTCLRKCNQVLVSCKPALIIYNTIIDSLCKDRLLNDARDLFLAMKQRGIKPNVVTYTSLIRGLYNSGFQDEAEGMLTEMLESKNSPDVITLTNLIYMSCKDGNFFEEESILKLMIDRGTPNIISACGLNHGYCKAKDIDKALNIYQESSQKGMMPYEIQRNESSWNSSRCVYLCSFA